MSADAEGEQTTAETEQGKADNQLAMAQELKRESQVASDAAAQLGVVAWCGQAGRSRGIEE